MSISTPTAGELNKRITLITRHEDPTTLGTAQATDTVIALVWAKIEPTGSYHFDGVQTEERATHRLWVRTRKGVIDYVTIGHGVYIVYGQRMLRPVRVTDANGQGKFTVIEAVELGDYDTVSSSGIVELEDDFG